MRSSCPSHMDFRPARRSFGPALARGMTLVELLVVVVIFVIVTAVAFTLYRVNTAYYMRQDARLEQTQNMRVALYTVARDVRMAGNSFRVLGLQGSRINVYVPRGYNRTSAGWFRHEGAGTNELGAWRLFGVDGGTNDSDTLTVFRTEVETGAPLGQLSADFTPGSSDSLSLQEPFIAGTLHNHDILAVVDGANAAIFPAGNLANPQSQPNPSLSTIPVGSYDDDVYSGDKPARFVPEDELNITFPTGSYIYNLRDVAFVTYYVDDDKKALMADLHDGSLPTAQLDDPTANSVMVANNIEDFQVNFFLNTGPPVTSNPAVNGVVNMAVLANGGTWVTAVNIGLSSISAHPDGQAARHRPVPLFNRTTFPGVRADQYPRMILTETITLRN